MLHYVLRIALALIAAAVAYGISKALLHAKKNRRLWISGLVGVIVLILSSLYPFENLFYHFQSPEQAFHYASTGTVQKVIDGEDSCMVIYAKDQSNYSQYFVLKSAQGYQLPPPSDCKQVANTFGPDGIFNVWQVTGTQDYYVDGVVHLKEQENIINVLDSSGQILDTEIYILDGTEYIYFYLPDAPENYHLDVNGQTLSITES